VLLLELLYGTVQQAQLKYTLEQVGLILEIVHSFPHLVEQKALYPDLDGKFIRLLHRVLLQYQQDPELLNIS
jgi:hypothetical protein